MNLFLRFSEDFHNLVYHVLPVSLLAYFEKAITEVNTGLSENESISLAQALKLSTDKASEIQLMREKGIDISIKTGLSELNREFNGGFRSPDFIIIGGRPSMGKPN